MSLGSYIPAEIEPRIYQQWLKNNSFAPAADAGCLDKDTESFCIVIPPPNVTGSLHLGHAWDETLQDVLIRWMRMEGRNTLWLPGTDHAGIATQWMVERKLKQEGSSKEKLGRKAFLEYVWRFKEESQRTINGQLKRIGVSCDWNRERFTLDEGLSHAVRRVFVELYREGLIYRGPRMVNWSPALLSAVSDLEVEYRQVQGYLWHIRYPVVGKETEGIEVATTRPETMLGDVAVAVHPQDARWQHLAGKKVRLPLAERQIPVIKDAYVDADFGSGAVKITPGHDPNDFVMGQRHALQPITVMNVDGSMADNVPEAYRGLDRKEARKKVLADLKAQGLLVKTEPHTYNVGFCSRSGVVIEPRISEQWFVDVKAMSSEATAAVKSRRIQLLPAYQEKVFFEWMSNIQDWCISRQLWWGHRIPAWYCSSCGEVIVTDSDELTACPKCQSDKLKMEEDVLDTWFSSALWPFSTMGWPEDTADMRDFYPTSVLVTGYDILFFWVARMVMMGLKFTDQVPFHQVLLHGLLRDEHGEKMSKTKGNGLNPLELVDEFGADALRFALAAGTVMGRDMSLGKNTVEGYRNFVNKLWNASRFVWGHKQHLGEPPSLPQELQLFDVWILDGLQQVSVHVREMLEKRRFNEAAKALYAFVWHGYCDWYLEAVKPILASGSNAAENHQEALIHQRASWGVVYHVLLEIFKLLHPFMPFVTEYLWGVLQPGKQELISCKYPQGLDNEALPAASPGQAEEAERLIAVIQTIRTLRSENMVPPKTRLQIQIGSTDAKLRELLQRHQQQLYNLAGLEKIDIRQQLETSQSWVRGVGKGFEIALCLEGVVDAAQEIQRLEKEMEKLMVEFRRTRSNLENQDFLKHAPSQVVEKNRQRMANMQTQSTKLRQTIARLSA